MIDTRYRAGMRTIRRFMVVTVMLAVSLAFTPANAQPDAATDGLEKMPGIWITVTLLLIPIMAGLLLLTVKITGLLKRINLKKAADETLQYATYIRSLSDEQLHELRRGNGHSHALPVADRYVPPVRARDARGLLSGVDSHANIRFIEAKRKSLERPQVHAGLAQLILWFLGTATFWLIFGTTVGEYLGIKFVAPDIDQLSWLSFGRLRPVHTNAVFWGWSSLAMLGLGYYVVPRVSNITIHSIRYGWWTLILINASVVLGSIALMAGINNGGGEYREYIWPIQLLFGIGLVITLFNFIKTVSKRRTREIYVSNWYIVAAVMFVIVITIVAYIPSWQSGLSETIIQGYYMHQGVGMWFMLFTLGLVYYYLPQQLNKPIYSYSLGILAFWSQIFFYTVIGTHHFVFSAIPWSLQTVAIVGSAGMAIPVIAGTTNFLMTFRGAWHKVAGSYTLPFFIVGIIFYFTGSLQGTAEAFRSTNLIWHFTDFTVAHSHLTMYGIIAFFLWGGIYAIVPRLTRQEPPQVTVGVHFWMAFIGMMFYTIPLMWGGTLRGLKWIEGAAFIESVELMAPYWLWRAIGGTLMWLSHLIFAVNMYRMIKRRKTLNINDSAIADISREDLESPELVKEEPA